MSADTSIGIAKFPDGWRCTGVVQAIDNIERSKNNETNDEFEECVSDYFYGSKVYKDEHSVLKYAYKLEEEFEKGDDYGMGLEYGIVNLGEFYFIPRDIYN